MMTNRVTVGEILMMEAMHRAVPVAGATGLGREVREVVVASGSAMAGLVPGVLVVVDGSSFHDDAYALDVALRALADTGGAGVVVLGPATGFGLATTRLANKLELPLVAMEHSDPLTLGLALRSRVRAPDVLVSDVVLSSLSKLRAAADAGGANAVLEVVGSLLGAATALIGAEGRPVAGSPLDPELSERSRLPVALTERIGDTSQVVHPVILAPGERPSFWLVARRPHTDVAWLETMASLLQVASWCLGTRLVSERLERERDARFRLGVLNAIIGASDHPEPALIEHMGVLGWTIADWTTAVHIHAAGAADQQLILVLTDDLRVLLEASRINAVIIERPDGWTLWWTTPVEPRPSVYTDAVTVLRHVGRQLVATSPGLRLYVGIGRPYQSFNGLRSSLAEARESSIIAQAGGGDVAVRHVDELGVKRILLGWYASDDFADFARTLLRPLVAQDPSGDLLTTMEAFLDHESSPTETASALGIHRNTVLNRVARARNLLNVDLGDQDERLAVQLACRVARVHSRTEGGEGAT